MFRCTKKGAVRWDAFQRRKRIFMVKFSNRVEQGATKMWEPQLLHFHTQEEFAIFMQRV